MNCKNKHCELESMHAGRCRRLTIVVAVKEREKRVKADTSTPIGLYSGCVYVVSKTAKKKRVKRKRRVC